MNVRRCVFGGVSWLVLVAWSASSFGKADRINMKVDGIEAIVTHVDSSDNPSDADWNIVLRPPCPVGKEDGPCPIEAQAFWSHFWFDNAEGQAWRRMVRIRLNWWRRLSQASTIDKAVMRLDGLAGAVASGAKAATFLKYLPDDPELGADECPGMGHDDEVHYCKHPFPDPDATWSQQCRDCAGGEVDSCDIPTSSSNVPCPKLFSCRTCIHDLRRLLHNGGAARTDALSNYAVKAEIFFGSESFEDAPVSIVEQSGRVTTRPAHTPMDMNPNLCHAMNYLGIGNICSTAGEELVCDEIRWDGNTWSQSTNGESACGKRVWISGWSSAEQQHGNRPEIHPVNVIVVEKSRQNDTARYSTGVFVDASRDDDWAWWSFDYRKHFKNVRNEPMSNTGRLGAFEIRPASFQPTLPGKTGSSIGSRQYVYTPKCRVQPVWSYHTENPQPTQQVLANLQQGGRVVCDKYPVSLPEPGPPPGSAFLADVVVSQEASVVQFALTSGVLKSPGGVISTGSPPPSLADANAAASQCYVPSSLARCGKAGGPACPAGLKRWYLFEISPFFESDAAVLQFLTWNWTYTPGVTVFWSPTAKPENKTRQKVGYWVPTWATETQGRSEKQYGADIEASVKYQNDVIVRDKVHLSVIQPSMALTTSDAKVDKATSGSPIASPDKGDRATAKGRKGTTAKKIMPKAHGVIYSASAGIKTNRFCGDSVSQVVSWKYKRGDSETTGTGIGPIGVSLLPGEAASITATARDQWSVETISKKLDIVAPELAVSVSGPICKDAGFHITKPEPGMWQLLAARKLCKNIEVAPSGYEKLGKGLDFPVGPSVYGSLSYRFDDVEIAIPTDPPSATLQWTSPPAGWSVVKSATRLSITPGATAAKGESGFKKSPGGKVGGGGASVQTATAAFFVYRGNVTVTDGLGRTVTRPFRGTNDFSPSPRGAGGKLVDIRFEGGKIADLLSSLWQFIKPGETMPNADPCGGACAGGRQPVPGDPVARQFSALRHSVERIATSSDPRAKAEVRSQLERFIGGALWKAKASAQPSLVRPGLLNPVIIKPGTIKPIMTAPPKGGLLKGKGK